MTGPRSDPGSAVCCSSTWWPNLSRNTQASYRDTLKVLLPFLSAAKRTLIDHLAIEEVSSLTIRRFLDHLEKTRRYSGATRNQRLAAIHLLAKFIATRSPQHLAWCGDLRSVPNKKTTQRVIDYLDKQEMDALLEAPHRCTRQGARDYIGAQLVCSRLEGGDIVNSKEFCRSCESRFGLD
jgi:site-specific recombinase XerD